MKTNTALLVRLAVAIAAAASSSMTTVVRTTSAHGALVKPASRSYRSAPTYARGNESRCSWSGAFPRCTGDWRTLNQFSQDGCGLPTFDNPWARDLRYDSGYVDNVKVSPIDDGTIEAKVRVTAYHGGKIEFRLLKGKISSNEKWRTESTLLKVTSQHPPAPTAGLPKTATTPAKGVQPCVAKETCAQLPWPVDFCKETCKTNFIGNALCGGVATNECSPAPERTTMTGPNANVLSVRLQLPESYRNCEHCILQWYWVTGNGGGPIAPNCAPWDESCGRQERFWNCADVRFAAGKERSRGKGRAGRHKHGDDSKHVHSKNGQRKRFFSLPSAIPVTEQHHPEHSHDEADDDESDEWQKEKHPREKEHEHEHARKNNLRNLFNCC